MSDVANGKEPKRLKLDTKEVHDSNARSPASDTDNKITNQSSRDSEDLQDALDDNPDDNCCICLQAVVDRTILPKCSHEFCFECILVWTDQSRRCPLCSQNIGEYLIHSIRSRYDYRKRFLAPMKSTSPRPVLQAAATLNTQRTRQQARRRRQDRQWGAHQTAHDEADKLERSIVRRRWIYEHDLYAKHVASNSYTKYRPYPTPAQFSASQDLISRTTTFIRRELQVWEGLDVEVSNRLPFTNQCANIKYFCS
ncbi:hypothetical protein CVT24_009628 [Panaeolus cyanescens]|uniref:RING-type E3 ubiquitin transferase n=1 Tax=Panaeolus cyanescens TaxID=181874 RepID=A0A409YA02_9AGAR|nr:hypothetical protein CVT24_009628 [Panaeolus cyanescens]